MFYLKVAGSSIRSLPLGVLSTPLQYIFLFRILLLLFFSLAKGLLNIWEKALSFKTLRWAGIGLLFIVIERLRHGLLSPSGYWKEEEEEEDVWKERGIIGHRAAAAVDSVLSPEWLMMIQTAFSPRFPCEPPQSQQMHREPGSRRGEREQLNMRSSFSL